MIRRLLLVVALITPRVATLAHAHTDHCDAHDHDVRSHVHLDTEHHDHEHDDGGRSDELPIVPEHDDDAVYVDDSYVTASHSGDIETAPTVAVWHGVADWIGASDGQVTEAAARPPPGSLGVEPPLYLRNLSLRI